MHKIDYKQLLEELSEHIEEGIQVIDASGVTVAYNSKMAQMEGTRKCDMRGVLYNKQELLPSKESSLEKALVSKVATINRKQSYSCTSGKAIQAINTTIPIIQNDQTIAALKIAKEVSAGETSYSNRIREDHIEPSNNKIRTYCFRDLVGEDENFLALIKKTKNIAKNNFPVLISGETGTGKELFAQSIHFEGGRRNKPFLAQNCAALPENLLESILFGTVKGSYTGAMDRPGLFEQASGGTLLLDEISAMPFALQSKLLRVLQEQYIRRVGDTKDTPVDVRIIATCNEPLSQLISQGSFRNDLYYRLSAISLDLIPLRDRKGDIPLLAEAFIRKHGNNRDIQLTASAKEKLLSHDYYGNVRELENVIISSISMMEEGHMIQDDHIQFSLLSYPEHLSALYDLNDLTLSEKLEEVEQEIIRRMLLKNSGNISRAAEKMGMKRQTLQYKLKKIQVQKIQHDSPE